MADAIDLLNILNSEGRPMEYDEYSAIFDEIRALQRERDHLAHLLTCAAKDPAFADLDEGESSEYWLERARVYRRETYGGE